MVNEVSLNGNVKKAINTLDNMDTRLAIMSDGRNVHQIANIRACLDYVRAILGDSKRAASVVELTAAYSKFIMSINSALKDGSLNKKDYGLVRKAWNSVNDCGEAVVKAVKETLD